MALQARGASQAIVTSRISRYYVEQATQSALYELARLDVARGMLSWSADTPEMPLNGTPVTREVFGQGYTVRYQDVAGMVDIYAASPALLTAVGIDADGFIAARERVLKRWPNGTRPATVEQSLGLIEAELGHVIGVEDGLRDVLTQRSGKAVLDPVTMALGLRGRMDVGTEAGVLARRGKQPERVVVGVK